MAIYLIYQNWGICADDLWTLISGHQMSHGINVEIIGTYVKNLNKVILIDKF